MEIIIERRASYSTYKNVGFDLEINSSKFTSDNPVRVHTIGPNGHSSLDHAVTLHFGQTRKVPLWFFIFNYLFTSTEML